MPQVHAKPPAPSAAEFDWHDPPLPEAERRLAEIRTIYERAAAIVLQRQSREPVTYRCWTADHKREVSKTVAAQCRGAIPDGRWNFKDDSERDADGRLSPVVTCSMVCSQNYLAWRNAQKYKAKLAVAGEEGGNLPVEVAAE